MVYTHTTFAAAKHALASRLSDVNKVFWSDSELGGYIKESLQVWCVAAAYWRARGFCRAATGTAFLDFGQVLESQAGSGNFLLRRTATALEVVNAIQYSLLEPATNGLAWSGTAQFGLVEIYAAIEKRTAQFLSETGAVVSVSEVAAELPTQSWNAVSEAVADVRRVAWRERASDMVWGDYYPLHRTDVHSAMGFAPDVALTPGRPRAYSVLTTPNVVLELLPPPTDIGRLHLLTVDTHTVAVPTDILNIPRDCAWVVKWGVLCDLLGKDGPARDPERAAYCETRWREGVELAKIAACVLDVAIDGRQGRITTVWDLDTQKPDWQNETGTPRQVGLAGLHLAAIYPQPVTDVTLTFDVVRNAPLPLMDVDFVDVARELLDVILDYAQHLASFKMGGAEFAATQGHYERLIRLASQQNERLKANAGNFDILAEKSQKEDKQRPRMEL